MQTTELYRVASCECGLFFVHYVLALTLTLNDYRSVLSDDALIVIIRIPFPSAA